jgi:hypothetical protein
MFHILRATVVVGGDAEAEEHGERIAEFSGTMAILVS